MLNVPATEQRAAQVGPAIAKPLRPVLRYFFRIRLDEMNEPATHATKT